MSTLVITNRYPNSSTHGYDLRVFSLSSYLQGPRHLLVAPFDANDTGPSTLDVDSIFRTTEALRAPFAGAASFGRHLRVSDAQFLKLAYPRPFAAAVAQIREAVKRYQADRLIVFGTNLASVARAVDFPRMVLDVCDSVALTQARQYRHDRARLNARERVRARLHLWRSQQCEAALPSWFSRVTTINQADTNEVIRLAGGTAANVHTVPNGVGEQFLEPLRNGPRTRGVAFWGNLTFAPNREAVRYFAESIYLPFLKPAGVRVCIIGKGAEPWLLDLARSDPQIELKGFVDQLPQAVAEYPVMVNPMLIGSGMKNKVLEAFGLGLVVVSTSLGAEAFPEAVAGTHYLRADEPASFAAAVLEVLDQTSRRNSLRASARSLLEANYRWEAIGRRWNELCEQA